jgi:4-hydroxy-3-polyprenylbenzoate decarboxylase
MESLSYKAAILSIDKSYPGQHVEQHSASGVQLLILNLSSLADKDINIRGSRAVVWAMTSKVDPARDVFILPDNPFDSLDFATERSGLEFVLKWGLMRQLKMYPGNDRVWGDALISDPGRKLSSSKFSVRAGMADDIIDLTVWLK